MRYLLDTNVVSELRKRERANLGVQTWIASVEDEQLFLSVLVVGELRQGIESVRRRDAVSARNLDKWLRGLTHEFAERIISIDAEVADVWGRLNVPDPLPTVDSLLAATARVHKMTLVTRNTRDVQKTGVALLNPFVGSKR